MSEAKLMPDDVLASMRREGSEHGLSRRETLDLLSHVDALVVRAEAAERKGSETYGHLRDLVMRSTDKDAVVLAHYLARAEAAEKKLAVLVKAATQAVYATVAAQVFGDSGHDAAIRALDAAIAAARGES